MKHSRTLLGLRHLCSLGLPAETMVPQFLATLGEAVPTEVSTLVWHGPDLIPVTMFSDQLESHVKMQFFVDFLGDLKRTSTDWSGLIAAATVGSDHPERIHIFDFIEHEVRVPLGLHHAFASMFTTSAGGYCSINLWRGGREYTQEEQAFNASVTRYLQYAINQGATAASLPTLAEDSCGVVLLDTNNALLQADEQALQLLALISDAPIRRGSDFLRHGNVARLLRLLGHDLQAMSRGRSGAPPQLTVNNTWGRFALRASWLQRPSADGSGTVAVTVTQHVPRRLKLWRGIQLLRLPPRQQEVALLFAEGCSQQEIAVRLNIGLTTVIDHIRRLYDRLHIAADRVALRERLLEQSAQVA